MQTCYHTHLPYLEQENGTCLGDEDSFEVTFGSESWSDQTVLEAVVPVQLENALELNRQLHASLQRKKEEISDLKQRNAQLKELVKQTELYNSIPDTFVARAQEACVCMSCPGSAQTTRLHMPWHDTASKHSCSSALTKNTERQGQPHPEPQPPPSKQFSTEARKAGSRERRQHHTPFPNILDSLWEEPPEQVSLYCPPDKKRLKLKQDSEQLHGQSLLIQQQSPLRSVEDCPLNRSNEYPQLPNIGVVRAVGVFHGLRVMMATQQISSDVSTVCRLQEGMCFQTSVREQSTVRTRVFPQGRTFTSHMSDGGCRFLWIPCEK